MQEGNPRASPNTRDRGERFVFQDRLGVGASGTVFRAYDRTREATVAVKVLTQVDPSSLYRFKAEFRALSGIVHPNLVQLYDLLTRDGEWLLTMELVEGQDFLRYVRSAEERTVSGAAGAAPASFAELDDLDGATATISPEVSALASRTPSDDVDAEYASSGWKPSRKRGAAAAHVESAPVDGDGRLPGTKLEDGGWLARAPFDERRLRSALRQLCEGLDALHRSNRLHRDLKPANILVFARDGRLVICDFGLISEGTRLPGANELADGVGIAGTLSYMSPEQATGQPLSEASDWYSVGVILYQALTGLRPYPARLAVRELIAAKQQGAVVHPCALAAEAPEDLANLAVALLSPDPRARPGYAEIVALLEGAKKLPSLGPCAPPRFVGRGLQLEQLGAAFARARDGSATMAMVGGRSGMGKSALVQHFLDELRERERAVVLAGRCYEHEQLPYKAFDPLVDALSAHLLSLSDAAVRELLPAQIGSLARLFPVLRRVPGVANAMQRGEPIDPLEQKRRAFSAFRALCRNISLRRPLVFYIDDLQWGDLDSGLLFTELLHPPEPPALLFVGAYRAEDERASPLLQALRETHLPESGIAPVDVRVEALSADESRALALSVLQGEAGAEHAAERVAEEAGGSPFFVRELALHVRANGQLAHGELRLDALITERLARLPEESRALFSLIATAGRPERRRVLQAAAKLGERTMNALRVLEAHNLIHSTGGDADDRVQVYHDRLRETACRLLAPGEQKRLHRALAEALEQSGARDPEPMFEHWREGGEPRRARACALEAAQNAEAQLAFERAARLYRAALELLEVSGEEARLLEEKVGHCLTLCGRGVEAADAFSRALVGASPARSLQLQGLLITQLLRAGRIDRAYEELKRAKALIGLAVPGSALRALSMLLWRRLKIRFKRLRWRQKARAKPALNERADLLWGVGASLAGMDILRGGVYQAEHMLVALRANEPYRLARAIAVEAVMSAISNRDPGRTQYLLDRALELGGMSGEPHALSVVKGTAACCRYLEGRFREAVRLAREAQAVIRERLNATLAWDLVSVVIFDLSATALLGDVNALSERVPEVLRDAEARGDLFAATACRSARLVWAWLGPDQPETARRQVELAESQWVHAGYHLQNWYVTAARAEIDLYSGTPEPSLARLEAEWSELRVARLMQCIRVESSTFRARLLLACARKNVHAQPAVARAQLAAAQKDARAVLAEQTAWGFALARLALAGVASFDDVEGARRLLRELEGQFDALDMQLHQEVARYRRGQLSAGEAGRQLVERASSAIRALGVARPAAFAAMLAPGFPSLDE